MDLIGSNLQAVKQRIANAALACGRNPGDIGLIAVSKSCGASAVSAAYALGQYAFGENQVQEALQKIAVLANLAPDTHIASASLEYNAVTSEPPPAGTASPEGPPLRPLESRIAQPDYEHDTAESDARGPSAGVASPKGPLLRPLESRIAQPDYEHDTAESDARGPSAGVASPKGPLLRPLESRIAQPDYEHDAAESDARGPSAGVASPKGPLLRPLESRIAQPDYEHDAAESDARGPSAGVASPKGPLLRPLEWHFIGPIQSNKTRAIAENFAWVHSVARFKIAERLSSARPTEFPLLQVCIQVNIGDENTKSGVEPDQALELARVVVALPRLRLRGLMTIPPMSEDHAQQRRYFARLRQIRDELAGAGITLDTLSMGMSGDLEAAIMEGATLVRVGTAIFGQRLKD